MDIQMAYEQTNVVSKAIQSCSPFCAVACALGDLFFVLKGKRSTELELELELELVNLG
jgi:endogenous inhibitor of DNA gyrase (YacG/DUF329 family)